jgi:hypothetical protein
MSSRITDPKYKKLFNDYVIKNSKNQTLKDLYVNIASW